MWNERKDGFPLADSAVCPPREKRLGSTIGRRIRAGILRYNETKRHGKRTVHVTENEEDDDDDDFGSFCPSLGVKVMFGAIVYVGIKAL